MRAFVLALSAALAALAADSLLAAKPTTKAKLGHKGNFAVAGWMVYWDSSSLESFEKHATLIDRVYPAFYNLSDEGLPQGCEAELAEGPERQSFLKMKQRTLAVARRRGIRVLGMAANNNKNSKGFNAALVEKTLYDTTLRAKHVQMLVDLAVKDGLDGIDVDYEGLLAKDAAIFCTFIAELRQACDAKGLLLAAALHPKTDDQGSWEGNRAHDYACLSKSLHLVRPMTYDEHWEGGAAGPVSSPEFTEAVDRYALGLMPASKLELGLAGYGYEWKSKGGNGSLSWTDLLARRKEGLAMSRDEKSQELRAKFRDKEGVDHEIWFCDALSYRPKFELIKKYKLAGLALWRLGAEDPDMWKLVKYYKFSKKWWKKAD